MGWGIFANLKSAFEPYPNLKNRPLGPQNAKNDPKIRSTFKVRIQKSIKNKSCNKVKVKIEDSIENKSLSVYK